MKTHEQIIELINGYNTKIADGEVVDLDDVLNLLEVEQRITFFKEFMRKENSVLMKEELCDVVLNDEHCFGLDDECQNIAIRYLNGIYDLTPATLSNKFAKEEVASVINPVLEQEEYFSESKVEGVEPSEIEKTMAFLKEILKRGDAESNSGIFKKKMQGSCEETKSALCKMILEAPELYELDEDCFLIAERYLASLVDATHVSSRIESAKQKFSAVMNSDDEQAKLKFCNEALERGGTYLNDQDWDRLAKFLIADLNNKIISAMLRDKATRDNFEKIMKSDNVHEKQRLAKAMLEGELVIAPGRQKWESISDVLMAELKARIESAASIRRSKGVAKSQRLPELDADLSVAVKQVDSVDDDNGAVPAEAAVSEFFAIPAEQKQEALVLVEALKTKVYGEKIGLDNDAAKGKPKFTGRRAPTRKPLSERVKPEVQVVESAPVEEVVVAPQAPFNNRSRPDARASMYVSNQERNRLVAAIQGEGVASVASSTNSVMATTSVPTSVAKHGVNMGISGAVLGNITLRRTQQTSQISK